MKKILLGFGALTLALVSASLVAAFEAHVVNVTATIENALEVSPTEIAYGTVFPQESLDRTVDITLSESFMGEGGVDAVSYDVKQKPKCSDGQGNYGRVTEDDQGNFICEDDGYRILPILCPYLSKEELTEDGDGNNDGARIPAFHGPIADWTPSDTETWKTDGQLDKTIRDIWDQWNLDLRVPCFEGECSQDWDDYVRHENENADPDDYDQPEENEHLLFGCDIWLEVTGVTRD